MRSGGGILRRKPVSWECEDADASDVEEESTGAGAETSRGLRLHEARAAAMSVLNFYLDNQDQGLCGDHSEDARRAAHALQRLTLTLSHFRILLSEIGRAHV